MPKVSVGESFTVLLVSGIEKVWIRGGRSIKTSVENSLSHRAESFLWGILYCFINFGYRKSLDKRGVEYQDSPSKTLGLTKPKNSVGKSFNVALIWGVEKVWIRGGESIKIFRRNNFNSQCQKFP